MYIWNVKALAQDLKAGQVSQKEKMKYFLVTIIVQMLMTSMPAQPSLQYGDFIRTVIFIIITAIGIVVCYKANSRGDDKEFVERIICLSLPIGVRISLLLFIGLILDIIIATVLQFGPQAVEVSIFIVSIIVLIITLTWMRSYIIDVSGAGENSPGIHVSQ
jgi:hypothetical protein